MAVVLLTGSAAACGDDAPAAPVPAPRPSVSAVPDASQARIELAALAALAQDRRFAALYTYVPTDGRQGSVVATVAADGSWRVDVAGGALGGTADVAVVSTAQGVFQCSLASSVHPVSQLCVQVADRGKRVPKEFDPKIERVFRQWLGVFTDRQAALSVSRAAPLTGSRGACFSVDSISASLAAAVDVGIYCYAEDGLLTAAKVDYGTVTIASDPANAPATVQLPGPIVNGTPMGMESPPPPPVIAPSVAPSTTP